MQRTWGVCVCVRSFLFSQATLYQLRPAHLVHSSVSDKWHLFVIGDKVWAIDTVCVNAAPGGVQGVGVWERSGGWGRRGQPAGTDTELRACI